MPGCQIRGPVRGQSPNCVVIRLIWALTPYLFLWDLLCAAMIATFVVTAVTGVLMFLHVGRGLVTAAHEWLGLAFVVLALWHVVRNLAGLRAYCRQPVFVGSLLIGLAVGGVLIAATQGEPPRGRGYRADVPAVDAVRAAEVVLPAAEGLSPAD